MLVRMLVAFLVAAPLGAHAAEAPKARLAVMPLASIRGVDKDVAKLLSGTMTIEIERLLRYEVVSADDVSAMLGFEKLKDAVGCSDASCVAEIGGALGVNLMVTGTLGTLGKQVKISLALFDTKKLKAIKRVQKFVLNDESLLDQATREVVAELFDAPAPQPSGPAPTTAAPPPTVVAPQQQQQPQPSAPQQASTPQEPAKVEPAKQEPAPAQPAPAVAVDDNAWLRTNTEWATLRLGGSLLGFGLHAGLFTVRWRYFYWQVLRFDLMLPLALGIYGAGGTFGVPLFFADDRHEVRFGASPMLMFYQQNISSYLTLAPVIAPEVVWAWHLAQHFALQAGLVVFLPIAPLSIAIRNASNPIFVSFSLTIGAAF